MVQRYEFITLRSGEGYLTKSDEGRLVSYEDYEKLEVAQKERECLQYKSEIAALKGSLGSMKDWEIDHSTDVPILVYKKCSVIESEQAYGLLNLIKQSELKVDQVPVAVIVLSKNWPDTGRKVIDYYIEKIQHLPVGTELFTAPQKPVVLSSSTVMSRAYVVQAIKAAGFTVEGE